MNINDIYKSNSNFLRHDDLKGNRVCVEIESFSIETLKSDGDDKQQVVLKFKGKDKCLGLNKTNAERIAAHVGSYDPANWIGWKIKIYPTTTQFQGKETPCIRVSEEFAEAPAEQVAERAVAATVAQSQPAIATSDDIPF